jgi:hypothetical protein
MSFSSSPTTEPAGRESRSARMLVVLITSIAAGALAVWFWNAICQFPTVPWNDLRLAPAIALAQGERVFSTSDAGVVSTWVYGPLPLLFYLPAALASSPGDALIAAGMLNVALTVLPLALVCFAWPAGDDRADSRMVRALAWLLCLAVWPPRHYEVIFADNLAIACGLVGNLLLVRSRSSRQLWLAAIVATAALACKQIAVAAPLAQIAWLGLTLGPRAAVAHALRCAAAGAAIGALAITIFGAEALWFTLFELPANVPWMPSLQHVLPALPEAGLQIVLPAVIMLWHRRAFARPTLLLPALAWACALPLGLVALCKTGGWVNSLHSLVLWLPPIMVTAATSYLPKQRRSWLPLAVAAGAAMVACGRVALAPDFVLRPKTAVYASAEAIAVRFPQQIWFPLSPLVTLYSDHRYYHDEDGLLVRRLARRPLPPSQNAAHLPTNLRGLAFRSQWNDWGIARTVLPPNARQVSMGEWTLWMAGP